MQQILGGGCRELDDPRTIWLGRRILLGISESPYFSTILHNLLPRVHSTPLLSDSTRQGMIKTRGGIPFTFPFNKGVVLYGQLDSRQTLRRKGDLDRMEVPVYNFLLH